MDPTGIFLDLDGDGEVEEVPASLIDSGNVRVTTVGPNGRPVNDGQFFINPNNGLLDAPDFAIPPGADKAPLITQARFFHQIGLVWDDPTVENPSSGLFGSYPNRNRAVGDALDRDGQIDNLRFVSARNLDAMFNNYARQGFTSIEQFDFGKNRHSRMKSLIMQTSSWNRVSSTINWDSSSLSIARPTTANRMLLSRIMPATFTWI